ncbi:hypothetical protein [Cellulomonas sp. NPDC089187]|uniref:hypothetical protein n=1 Tax=Cellulomonas sp. NPDC089187 TaxID=3154970 RepID=UPI0034364CBB
MDAPEDLRLRAELTALTDRDTSTAMRLLKELSSQSANVPVDELARWLVLPGTIDAACGLLATSTDPGADDLIHDLLTRAPAETHPTLLCVALRRGDRTATPRALELLRHPSPTQTGQLASLITALGRWGDRSAAPALRDLVATASPALLFHLNTALFRLTGRSPVPTDDMDTLRRWWAEADLDTVPAPQVDRSIHNDRDADLVITDGRAAFALDTTDPGPSSPWPIWTFAWTMSGEEIYHVGSVCGTCEVFLERTGWAPEQAVQLARTVATAVTDVPAVTDGLIDALIPVLGGLASGQVHLRLRDTPLRPVRTWEDTWFTTTRPAPDPDAPSGPLDATYYVLDAHRPLILAPTQPDDVLDPDTVRAYAERIASGERPAVVAAAHAATRTIIGWGQYEDRDERSVTALIVDGHHKLAAYARLGIPARVIWLCDLSWSLSDEPETVFAELLD